MENRRKVLFIDKKFQLNLIFKLYGFFCFLFLAFIFVTYLLINPLMVELSHLALPADHPISMIVQNFKFFSLWIIILSFLALSCFVIMASLLISHKIAGPVFSMKRTLREISENGEFKEAQFRQKDYFLDLMEQFNKFITYLESSK